MSEQLHEAVRHALQTNPYLHGKTLRWQVEDNRLVLHGRVHSYFQKQMAQEALRRVAGVPPIENLLEVAWPEDQSTEQSDERWTWVDTSERAV